MRVGDEILRVGGIVFDFQANLPDEGAQIFELVAILRAPYRAQQFGVGNRPSGVHHEVMEQLELLGRKVNGAAVLLHQVAAGIEQHIADEDGGFAVFEGFAAVMNLYGCP